LFFEKGSEDAAVVVAFAAGGCAVPVERSSSSRSQAGKWRRRDWYAAVRKKRTGFGVLELQPKPVQRCVRGWPGDWVWIWFQRVVRRLS
jgi:hypothetical protein